MMARAAERDAFIDDGRAVLSPYDVREAVGLKRAAEIAGKSEGTMCIEHAIGRRVGGGTWQVSCPALLMLLDGNRAALAAYHRGDRGSPVVAAYFARCGLAELIEPARI
jgi:hypothetical protein